MLPTQEILSQSQAESHVGGIGVWQELMEHYGPKKHQAFEMLPFRITPANHRKWKLSEINDMLDIAQVEGTLRVKGKV